MERVDSESSSAKCFEHTFADAETFHEKKSSLSRKVAKERRKQRLMEKVGMHLPAEQPIRPQRSEPITAQPVQSEESREEKLQVNMSSFSRRLVHRDG